MRSGCELSGRRVGVGRASKQCIRSAIEAVMLPLEPRRLLAAITWDGGASGDWSVATNWDLDRLPNAGDDVIIGAASTVTIFNAGQLARSLQVDGTLVLESAGSLRADQGGTINDLTLNGGSLQWGQTGINPTVTGDFNWTGGVLRTLGGNAIVLAGTTTLSGADAKTIFTGLNITGTLNHGGTGNLRLNDGNSDLTIGTGGVYNFTGEGDITDNGASAFGAVVTVQGTMRKTAGNPSEILSNGAIGFVVNGGTVESSSGTLRVDRNNVSAASVGGTLNATGTGVVELAGFNQPLSGTFTGSGDGRVVFQGGSAYTFTTLTFNFPAGLLEINDATMNGVTNAGALEVGGTATIVNVNNTGTLSVAENATLNGGGSLSNPAGAVLEVRGGSKVDNFFTINNAGTLRKTGTGTATIATSVTLNSTQDSIIEATGGILSLNTNYRPVNAKLNASTGAEVQLSHFTTVTGTLTGTGAGRVALVGGQITAGATPASISFPAGLFEHRGGVLLSNPAGQFQNTGTITVPAGGTGTVSGTFNNAGTMVVEAGGTIDAHNANLVITSTGVVQLKDTAAIGRGTFTFAGTLQKTGAGTATIGQASPITTTTFQPGGRFDVDAGQLNVLGNVTLDGTFFDIASGAAVNLSGSVTVRGTLSGSGGGKLTSSGSFVSGGVNSLEFPQNFFTITSSYVGEGDQPLRNNGFLEFGGVGDFTFRANIENYGTVRQSYQGTSSAFGFAILKNLPGAVWEFTDTTNLRFVDFQNSGTVRVNAPGKTATIQSGFTNTGGYKIQAVAGTLLLSAGGTYSSTQLEASPGATIEFGGGSSHEFKDGVVITSTGTGSIRFTGAIRNFEAADAGPTINLSNLFIGNGANFIGEFNLAGTTTLEENANFFIRAGGETFRNTGTFNHVGGGFVGIDIVGNFVNEGTYNLLGDGDFQLTNLNIGAQPRGFINRAVFRKTGGTGLSELRDPNGYAIATFNNQGTVEVTSGTLRLGERVEQLTREGSGVNARNVLTGGTWVVGGLGTLEMPGGTNITPSASLPQIDTNRATVTLDGATGNFAQFLITRNDGTFGLTGGRDLTTTGAMNNTGTLRAGPGSTLSVNGTLTNTGTLRFDVGGSSASGLFGQINASGAVTLGGIFNVALESGFAPSAGDAYVVMSAPSINGTFANFTGLDPFFTGGVNVGAANVTLNATSGATAADFAPVAASIVAPASGVMGQNITVTFDVSNLSPSPVTGTWRDSVYLSTDAVFDPFDTLLGRVPVNQGVAGSGSYSQTLTAPVPGLPSGSYFLIVVADSSRTISDTNLINNTVASASTINLSVPALAFDTPTTRSLASGQDIYYSLVVPPGSDVTLDASFAQQFQGEFFVRFGQLPTRSVFDFTASNPLELQRRIELNSPTPGTYYILVHGLSGAGAGSPFTLTARAITFGVSSIRDARGSNLGAVTSTVLGSGFTPNTVVELVDGASVVATAESRLGDNNTIFARFNLNGLPAKVYDVRVSDGAKVATLSNAFTVTAEAVGRLEVTVSAPGILRPGRLAKARVDYRNAGATDLVAPLLLVTASNAQLKLTDQALFAGNNLLLLGINPSGLAGVLPPGASGSITFDIVAAGDNQLDVFSVDPNFVINWDAMKDNLKPQLMSDSAWDVVYANFRASVGSTADQYNRVLADNASQLSEFGEYVYDIERLLSWEVSQADYSGDISQRHTFGAMGFGIPDPTDIQLVEEDNGDVRVYASGLVRFFRRNGSTYTPNHATDVGKLSRVGSDWQLRETDGSRSVFGADGKIKFIEDRNGNRRTANYTSGRLSGWTDSAGQSQSYTFDAAGRIISQTDQHGRVTTVTWDAAGLHVTSITDDTGTTTFEYYTGVGGAREHALKSITLPGQGKREYEYDSLGRLSKQTRAGQAPIIYSYDSAGGIITTDADGNVSQLFYDDKRRLAKAIDRRGLVYLFDSDAAGNLVRAIEPGKATTTFAYDALNNLVKTTDAQGHSVSVGYDPVFNQLNSFLNERGFGTSYSRDAEGNIGTITYPDGTTIVRGYNDAGFLTSVTNRRGQATTFSYDADNLIQTRTRPDTGTTTYGYDARTNLTSLTDSSGVIDMDYDALNRLTKVTYANGRSLAYSYDAQGRLARTEDQTGFAFIYSYAPSGQLASVSDTINGLIVSYDYDALGRLSTKTNGDNTTTEYQYDEVGNVKSIIARNAGGAERSRIDYTYTSRNQRATETTAAGTTTYAYDAKDQLISVTLPGGRLIEYAYDAAGNRISVTDSGVVSAYASNNLNQYTSAGTTTFAYDDDGNLISKTVGGVTTTYAYNAAKQLVSATSPTETIAYEYDALGQLVAVVKNGQRTEYLVDPLGVSNVFAQYDGAGNLTTRFARGRGLAAQVDSGGDAYYYMSDAIGNVREIAGTGGAVVNSYTYLPFGESLSSVEGIDNAFTFGGSYGALEIGAGRFLMRNRSYDPTIGRFAETDPLDLSGGQTNVYTYVRNNPANGIDPLGLQQQNDEAAVAGAYQEATQQADSFVNNIVDGAGRLAVGVGGIGGGGALFAWGLGEVATVVPATAVATNVGFGVGGEIMIIGVSTTITYTEVTLGLGAAVTSVPAVVTGAATIIAGGSGLLIGTGLKQIPIVDRAGYAVSRGVGEFVGAIPVADQSILGSRTLDGLRDGTIRRAGAGSGQGGSGDPNDIIGPAGVGAGRFITTLPTLDYTINFENMPTASLAAQDVFITHTLDADLDVSTFEIGSFGFGGRTFDVPAGLNYYHTQLDLIAELDIIVDVEISIDPVTRLASWTLRTLDPETGDLTAEPLDGFLPPNLTSPEGQGFVSYSVRTKDNLTTGTKLDQQARIVFDLNEPIDTPVWTNTIDVTPPSSAVSALPAQSAASFNVAWTGDDGVGSGIASYDIFVSIDNGPFTLWLDDTTLLQATYNGTANSSYAFYSVATDHIGFVEAAPTGADASTTVVPQAAPTISITGVATTEGNAGTKLLTFTVTRTGDLSLPSSVNWQTADVEASADSDYVAASGTVNFIAGDASETFDVVIYGDTTVEEDERFTATLSAPNNGVLGTAQAIGTIQNDDAPVPDDEGSITGYTFNDTDVDGVLDAGETRTSNRTVFLDTNNNGRLDAGERSTKTASDGSFNFTGLTPGTYLVRRIFPNGYTYSNQPINITLQAGQQVSGANIGSKRTTTPPPSTGSITGYTFNDTDVDGVLDSGETRTSNRTVFLDTNNNGRLDTGERSTKTASDGSFKFTGLTPGTYLVRRIFPNGYTYSNQPINITLQAGQQVSGANIGSKRTTNATGTIGGRLFWDDNGNGVLNKGEPWQSGKTVFLDLDNDGKLENNEPRTVTDSQGRFVFSGQNAGTYYVKRVVPAGFKVTTAAQIVNLSAGGTYDSVLIGTTRA